MTLLLLLGCWIGPAERAAWAERHTPAEVDAEEDTAADADTDVDTDTDTDVHLDSAEEPLFVQASRADAVFLGAHLGERLGSSLAVGDVTGDGADELFIGAPSATVIGAADAGRVYGFSSATSGMHGAEDAALLVAGALPGGLAGQAIAAGGDLDGDGYGDLVVGAPGLGSTWILFGPVPPHERGMGDRVLTAGLRSEAGRSLAFVGNCDDDGLADFVIGAPGYDRAFVVRGATLHDGDLGTDDGLLRGEVDGDRVGAAVAGPGDVDGDGLDDVLVGAPQHVDGSRAGVGAVYLIHGPAPSDLGLGLADATLVGDREGGAAGTSVSGPGDVDGDGRADLLVGGVDGFWLVTHPGAGRTSLSSATAAYGNDAKALRVAVAGAGDIDGDGWPDLAVGALGRDEERGAVWLLYGKLEGGLGFEDVAVAITGMNAGDELGFSLANASDSGQRALLVGAPGAGDANTGAAYFFTDIAR